MRPNAYTWNSNSSNSVVGVTYSIHILTSLGHSLLTISRTRKMSVTMKVFLAVTLMCLIVSVSAKAVMKREVGEHMAMRGALPVKRPFCNAFTGCGRKRSETVNVETADDLMKVSQKIVGEARLWELLQRKLNKVDPVYEPLGQVRDTFRIFFVQMW
ncbi:hypothetical protein HDE_01281 [Halotydeus destructor]|nr:hypothetical protein HDE_01281 [Halotydeus destructor]